MITSFGRNAYSSCGANLQRTYIGGRSLDKSLSGFSILLNRKDIYNDYQ
jgi:hypothetical protein